MEPYCFAPLALTAPTIEAFLEACRLQRTLAAEHLRLGYFEPWLRDAGRPDLAGLAAEVRQEVSDPADGLTQFLEAAAPAAPFDPRGWPSASLAFDFVRPSYELLSRRFEAVENRGRAILTFASSVTVAAPAFALAVLGRTAPPFSSPLFALAVVAFAGVIVCAVLLAQMGKLQFIDPQVLYDSYLDCSETEFRLVMLSFAGQHFLSNSRVVFRVNRVVNFMSALLLIEVVALSAWVLRGQGAVVPSWI